jgi:uncharacterized protein (DUF1697 family)
MRRESYVALLRGINLGARNKVSMADLKELFAALKAEDVETYLRSGNVVFKSAAADRAQLTDEIESRIRAELGLDVTVLLRTKTELGKVVAGNPFAGGETDVTKLHVTFLAEAPERALVRKLDPARAGRDEFRVVRQEIYLHCPDGYGRSKLSNAYFERQLGLAATTRNWNTVTQLGALAGTTAT